MLLHRSSSCLRRSRSPAPRVDLSRLTNEQFERLDQLRERIPAVGLEGLTSDEQMEVTGLRELIAMEL